MTAGIGQLLAQWDRAPDGAVLDVAAAISGLALDIVGRACSAPTSPATPTSSAGP